MRTEPRSTDAADYQGLAQAIGALVKSFPDGHVIAPHAHERDQLLYAVSGAMRLQTEQATMVVPPERAAYIPAGLRHSVGMHGQVEMRTLYIAPTARAAPAFGLRVIAVSNLLRELIVALGAEPMRYPLGSRGDRIAALIADELSRARELAYRAPLPRDPRLQRLCAALLADPGDRRTLNAFAEIAGASARTLARLFERELGMRFRDWRQQVRFQAAIEALSRGDSVERTARAAGYHSASAFSAAFRAAMGVSPSEFNRVGISAPRREAP